jgi:eukaryotic-like serine/threonine-protein kinase
MGRRFSVRGGGMSKAEGNDSYEGEPASRENLLTRAFRRLSTVATTRLLPTRRTPRERLLETPLRSPPRKHDPEAQPHSYPTPPIPETWGEFRLLEEVGKGAFGSVFRAWEEGLDREVALKLVPADRAGSDASGTLLREAQLLAKVSHPNVMTVHGARRIGAFVGIWSEFLSGNTLAQLVERDGPMRAEEATIVGIDMCRAIAAVHQSGLVHRDVKAENVLRQAGGRLVLVDFGTGRTLEAADDTEEISGTPLYMAPEILEGGPPTVRSDLYSLGVLLFFLVTGRFPVHESSTEALRLAHRNGCRLMLRDARADLPAAFVRIVERALDPDPHERYASAGALELELSRSMGVEASHPGKHGRGDLGRLFRNRWLVAVASVVASVAVSALVVWAVRSSAAPSAPTARGERGERPFGSDVSSAPFSLVVLPIENRSDDSANDSLGAGITDILTADLASIPGLLVVRDPEAASTANPHAAAEKLGVSHILAGSLQRSGEEIRVALQLTAKNDSRVLWSRVFDGSMKKLFELEHRIAVTLVGELTERRIVRSQDSLAETARETTADDAAFTAYGRARLLLDRSDKPENLLEATRLLENAVARDPAFALAHAALAEAYWLRYRDRLEEASAARAQTEALEALRLDPTIPGVRLSLALVYQGTGRDAEAIEELERLLDRQPASDEALRLLGRIHSADGNLEGAVESISRAVALRPDFGANYAALGLAYFHAGRYPEAIAAFQKLTQLEPDGDRGFQMLGTAYHASGDLDAAAVQYQRALALAPSATAYSNLGTIDYVQGKFEDALRAFEQSDRIRPGVAATQRNLGDAERRLGRDDEADRAYRSAIDLAEKALEVNPTDARAMALQGLCEAKLSRHPEAERLFEKALAIGPRDNEVLYKQAAALALAGRRTEALAALESALGNGYSAALVELDDDLDSIRSAPEFREMLRRAEQPRPADTSSSNRRKP